MMNLKRIFICTTIEIQVDILTAKIIDSYIDYKVRKNPNDYKTIGLVGTDIKHQK